MSERIAVGVDAGGTSAVAAVSRDGAFATTARGGPANPSSLGTRAAALSIASVVRTATDGATPGALFVAAAGAGRAETRAELARELAACFDPRATIVVEDDARVALRAGIAEGPGLVVIGGTGSVAYAESGERRVRIGGAGYLAGDEGSAFAIGMAGVRRLARVFDGREAADATSSFVARALATPDRDALIGSLYAGPLDVARIAGLARTLVAFAGEGDRVATKIVQTAAQDLGDLAKAVARQSDLVDASPVVVLAGGLLRENSLLTFLLETRIANDLPGSSVIRVRDEPARTALRFAEALGA